MSQQPQKGPVYSVTPCNHHHQCHMVLCQSFGKSSIHCCFSCFCSKYMPLYPPLLKPFFLFSFPSSSIIILFHPKHLQSGLPSSGLCSKLFCFSYFGRICSLITLSTDFILPYQRFKSLSPLSIPPPHSLCSSLR